MIWLRIPNQTLLSGLIVWNSKECLCKAPILYSPNFTKPFIFQTDASDQGTGAVLSQKDDEGNDYPVAYYRRKILPREKQYSTIEKKMSKQSN